MAIVEPIAWALVLRCLVALGVGGLIGLERERHGELRGRPVYAGIRTMPLVALAGAVLAWFSVASPWILVVGVLVFGSLALLIGWARMRDGTAGVTSQVALIVTFLLGALAGAGQVVAAAAFGILTAALLLERGPLHRFAGVLETSEIRSAFVFLLIAAVLLPLAPAEAIDPWDAFVPRTFVAIVTAVSVVSFLGFLAMRWLGPARGLLTSAVLAGLVNSDAAAGAVAALARGRDALRTLVIQAGHFAMATSWIRNMVIAVIVDPSLAFLTRIGPGLAGMAIGTLGWAAFKIRGGETPQDIETPRMASPFSVGPAFRFAGMFAVVTFAAAALQRLPGGGEQAVYVTAVGGLVSSAAVTASMGAGLAQGNIALDTAAVTALLAAAASALIKPFVVAAAYRPVGRAMIPAAALAASVALTAAAVVAWM